MVKNLPANAGDIRDAGSIPGSERSPGGGNGSPPRCSGLENSKDRAAWQAAIHRATESDISECHKGQAIWVTATRMLRWPRLALFHRCSTLLFTGHIVKNAEKVQV